MGEKAELPQFSVGSTWLVQSPPEDRDSIRKGCSSHLCSDHRSTGSPALSATPQLSCILEPSSVSTTTNSEGPLGQGQSLLIDALHADAH